MQNTIHNSFLIKWWWTYMHLIFAWKTKIFIKLMAFWLLQKVIEGSILLKIFNSINNVYNQTVKVWLGGPTKNTFKGQPRNKNWSNNILGPFSLNVFIFYFILVFIYYMPKYMSWIFHYKKGGNCYKFVFLVDVAPLGIKFLKFGNS